MEFIIIGLAVLIAGLILYALRRMSAKNLVVMEETGIWDNTQFNCPKCKSQLIPGYTMAGKGIIWTPKEGKKIGFFAHIGQALENTLNFGLPQAFNMSWRCEKCRLILVDHAKMIKRKSITPKGRSGFREEKRQ